MISYNPRDWFGLIFRFHKADTFRKLFWVMLSLAVFCYFVVYIELEVFHLKYASTTAVHSLLGFVISLLLVFRTNTAYDRWWEGRKQWGALVNVSRNLALKVNSFIPPDAPERRLQLQEMIGSYATVLRDHLRNEPASVLISHLPVFLQKNVHLDHVPNYLADAIQRELLQAYREHDLSEATYLALLNDLNQFTDICGACERIKKTPIPYTYNIFIKKFIFVYTITMPFGFVSDFGYWSIAITVFTLYTLASLELIAEEIEDPFGKDSNDLPTDTISNTIAGNVREIIQS